MPLTPKQAIFVKEYLIDKNASRAALAAGYSAKTAPSIGAENLMKPQIKEAIDSALKAQAKRLDISADRVLLEITRLALADISRAYDDKGELLPIQQIPEDLRRAIASTETEEIYEGFGKERVNVGQLRKIKWHDKPRSLEMLAKHFKLLTDKVEHTGKDGKDLPQAFIVQIVNAAQTT